MLEEDDIFALEPIPRRVKPLFFMIDTSSSMAGVKIASINAAVHEFLEDYREVFKHKTRQIKIGALEFSSGASWMYDKLIEAESFQWQDLIAAGLTAFGAACDELNQKLSKSHGWMNEPTGISAPTIILTTDGSPTDEWHHAFEKLSENNWFKTSCKIAIAIGQDADEKYLGEFLNYMDPVIRVHNGEQLRKIIYTACTLATHEDNSTRQLLDFIHNDPTLIGVEEVCLGEEVVIFPDTDEIVFWCCRGYIEPDWDSDTYYIKENSISMVSHRDAEVFKEDFGFCQSHFSELLTVLQSLNLKLIPEGNRYSELYNAKGLKLYRKGEEYFSCFFDEDGRNFVSDKPLDFFENRMRECIPDSI